MEDDAGDCTIGSLLEWQGSLPQDFQTVGRSAVPLGQRRIPWLDKRTDRGAAESKMIRRRVFMYAYGPEAERILRIT